MDDTLEYWYNQYKLNKTKKKSKVKDWVIVDEYTYHKYKDNIKLDSIKEYSAKNKITGFDEKIVLAESKDKYILIKYNCNFIAINLCEREYEITDNITLLMVNENAIKNIENKQGVPPSIKEIIGILGWKATRKAIINLEVFD